MSKSNNYCALKKLNNVDDAFSYMAGEYYHEKETPCQFSILDDDTFPKYILFNAISLIDDVMMGNEKEETLALDIPDDFDGMVTPNLLAYPFLLWSKKLNAFYCFHFDVDMTDVGDEEFCEAYTNLIKAYDFAAIVKKAKEIMANWKVELSKNHTHAFREIYSKYGVGFRKFD